MADTTYNYPAATKAFGIPSFGTNSIKGADPGILTGTTIGNLINSLTGKPQQDALGDYVTPNSSQSAALGNTVVNSGNPISNFANWFEKGFQDGSIRIGVVILGFILVAVGLSMFKNGEIKIEVKK